MKKSLLHSLLFLIFFNQVQAQTTETFETETFATTSFTDNGQVFNITTQLGGFFRINSKVGFPFGFNGLENDWIYISNDNYPSGPSNFTISSQGATVFNIKQFYLFLGSDPFNTNVSGTLTIKGKLAGVTQFTATQTSPFNNTFIPYNNGFTLIDFITFGGTDNSAVSIDSFEITTSSGMPHIALDAMTWQFPCGIISNIVYVNKNATGANNGSSWTDAYTNLQDGINACGIQVWVASGTYYPTKDRLDNATPSDNRNKTFLIKSGASVYGGFAGTETALNQRNWGTNQTVLSGDIGTTGLNTDNVNQVVRIESASNTTRLDGFIIKDGYANGDGGGILIRPNTNTCTPTVANCVITNNSANWGAGCLVDGRVNPNAVASPFFNNCVFTNNATRTNLAGALGVFGADANDITTVTNCTFAGNATFRSPFATVFVENATLNLTNSIVFESVTPATAISGTGIINSVNNTIDINPLFINSTDPDGADNIFMTADDGLRLGCQSPCFNTGTNTSIITTDILGNPRPAFTTADMGAYESQVDLNVGAPTATTPQTFCSSINPTYASIVASGTAIKWYTALTGGSLIANGTALISGNYFCSQTISSCESLRTQVAITINAVPTAPTAPTPIIYIQNASATALTATSGGLGLLWYTVASGGLGSTTAPTPITTALGNTTYYVSSTTGGCESATRTPITVTVALPATHLNFDGINNTIDFVALPTTATGIPTGNSNYTIEAWINPSDIGTDRGIVGWGTYGTTNQVNALRLTNNGIMNYWWGNDFAVNFTFPLNTWSHVAATYDGTTRKIFVNGAVVGQDTPTGHNVTTVNNVTIGKTWASAQNFHGGIDDVRIWNIARTANEIFGSKNCELQGNESGLQAYYKFNQGIDAATNTGIVTATNSATATGVTNNSTLNNFALTGATSNWLAGSVVNSGSVIPIAPTAPTPIIYIQNASATALTATSGGAGLLWYTVASGGSGSITAPTPITTALGNTTYYVSSTNVAGCESATRTPITVTVALPATQLNFDGINNTIDFVALPTTATGIPAGNSNYTIEAWINSSDIGTTRGIVGWGTYGTTNQCNALRLTNNGIVNYWWGNDLTVNYPFPLNNWSHVAATYDGTTRKIYVNGVVIDQDTPTLNSHNVTTTNNVTIGKTISSAQNFHGGIDDVRIWNIARTANEIFGSKNCELQGNESGLQAYYKFNQGIDATTNTAIVNATNSATATGVTNNATLNNFALTGATSNWLAGSVVPTGSIIPSAPTANAQSFCGATTVTSLVPALSATIKWYSVASGGTALLSGDNLASGTYYVVAVNANGCESSRTTVAVTVNAVQAIVYVKKNATGLNNGTSWTDAYVNLQDGINACGATEVWVAAGTYKPTHYVQTSSPFASTTIAPTTPYAHTDRNKTFLLKSGVSIYGGFSGNETLLSERNWGTNQTILSGDLGIINNTADNSYHVVLAYNIGFATRLDGFTIKNGNANNNVIVDLGFGDSTWNSNGGGIFSRSASNNMIFANLVVSNSNASNFGGGIYNIRISNPTLTNVTITNNTSALSGGGIYNSSNSSPRLTNVTIANNTAATDGGGIYSNLNSNPTLINVTIVNNNASNGGGIFNNSNSSPRLTNVTIANNNASNDGGGIFNDSSNPFFKNTIVWGNTGGGTQGIINPGPPTNRTYSNIQGVVASGNNISTDPNFVDISNPAGTDGIFMTADDGLRLSCDSPSFNTGDNTGVATTDILGNPRLAFATADMGAYESQVDLNPTAPTATSPQTFCVSFTIAGLVAIGSGIKWYAGPSGGVVLATSTALVNGTTYYATQTIGTCESTTRTAVTVIINATGVVYVNGATAASGDGTTWATAYKTVQEGINAPCATQVWVKSGTYYPTQYIETSSPFASTIIQPAGQTDRNKVIKLKSGVSVYGGFNGTETLLSQRNWTLNPTILSGDLDNNDNPADFLNHTDNAYHVVLAYNLGSATRLDGFTIKGGNGNSTTTVNLGFGISTWNQIGAGIFSYAGSNNLTIANNRITYNSVSGNGGGISNFSGSSPTLTNVTIANNNADLRGGGIYNGGSNPTITNVTITNNTSASSGGGIYNFGSNPTLTNVTIFNNTASTNGGGIFNSSNSNPTLTNVTIVNNTASTNGGGIFNSSNSNPTLTNVTIANNTASNNGGGIFNDSSNPIFKNTIVWGNNGGGTQGIINPGLLTNRTYSNIQGVVASGNNISSDPLFINSADPDGADNIFMTADDGLRLSCGSPSINTGTNTGINYTDILGNLRPQFLKTDMGAYESPFDGAPITTSATRLYVKKGITTGLQDGSSWANAMPEAAIALRTAHANASVTEIWVSAGTYLPLYDAGLSSCPADNRAKTFLLKSGVAIYGGFDGTETVVTARNWTLNPTILSGDLDNNDNPADFLNHTDNAYHVVLAYNLGSATRLDGFTIKGGNANNNNSVDLGFGAATWNQIGAGILSYAGSNNLTIANNTITYNTALGNGGGIYNESSNPILTNLTIANNKANSRGGGIYNYLSNPNLTNVSITNNTTGAGGGGGGIYNDNNSNPTLTNVTIANNTASFRGGGIYNSGSNPNLTNVTIANNAASNTGGGIFNTFSTPILKNTIVWGNTGGGTVGISNITSTPNITYSNIQGLAAAGTNISTDPLFINSADPDGADNIFMTADDGLALSCGSPSINTGTNTGINYTDILGNLRPQFLKTDMGAYESPFDGAPITTTNTRLYVKKGITTGLQDGSTWVNAMPEAAIALRTAHANASVTEIWVSAGTYLPLYDHTLSSCPTDNRAKTFWIRDGVSIYGGFDGTETVVTARNWTLNPTILSGDLDNNDNPANFSNHTNNAYHVVLSYNSSSATRLDGFTIKGGNANNSAGIDLGFGPGAWNQNGGGILSRGGGTNLSLQNLIIFNNRSNNVGGGIFNTVTSNPTLTNVNIANNSAVRGGGIYNDASNPNLTNVTIANNNATNTGGGIYNFSSSNPTLTNVIITNNTATNNGGGIYNFSSSNPNLTNVTIANNTATNNGGGIFNDVSNPILKNIIVWGNTGIGIQGIFNNSSTPNITYSNIQGTGTYTGTGNINTNPNFINIADPDGADNIFMTADDGLALQSTSPSIDTGDNAGAPLLDILGNPIYNSIKDMGAYEFFDGATCPPSAATTWNGTTWNNGTPTLAKAAIFFGNYTSTGNLDVCRITVNNGATVTMASGHVLTVRNTITTNATGYLIFENNASLIQKTNVVNTTPITYKRNSTLMNIYDYTYWSSPVANQNLNTFSPATLFDKYFYWNTTPSVYYWSPILNGAATMNLGQGYIIRSPLTPGDAPAIYNGSFVGNPNNGNITVPVEVSGALNANSLNLLGNPYPSGLSADLFLTTNQTKINGTIWFWSHNTPLTSSAYTSSDYASYNLTGGTGTSAINIGLGLIGNNSIPNGNIAAGQAFFAEGLLAGTNNVDFTNAMRTTSNSNFYRSANANELEKNRIWLELSNNQGAFSQILYGNIEGATNDKDQLYDGYLFDDTPTASLYSILDNDRLTIKGNGLPFAETDVNPLGYISKIADNYTIKLSLFDGIFESQNIYIEDKLLNIVHDLKQSDYSFATTIGTFNDRFVLRFNNQSLANNTFETIDNNIIVSKKNQTININSANTELKEIQLFDIRGRLIAENKRINSTKSSFENLNLAQQILIVKIKTIDNKIISKKIVF